MNKQMALSVFMMGLVLLSMVSAATGLTQIAGSLNFNLTSATTQTLPWILKNNDTNSITINVVTPNIAGIAISSSIGNATIPSNTNLLFW